MKKVRLILMFQGSVEYDFETKMEKPRLKETISIEKDKNCSHYDVEFIQHFFNEKGVFQYIMITGVRKS
jgi:hypothetical protein